ncbi:MAG: 2OG-Fe dioxygenase family protein [Gallionella sp.]|nr:2OG-Fe dioxygenase family protein [Gallionella sp.]MDD4958467.1 2OG-Fe dioxygenase family protein [Gallionella sp.]
MTIALLPPTYLDPAYLAEAVQQQGYGVLSPNGFSAFIAHPLSDWMRLKPSWNQLPPDQFLKDGGSYRQRRHASFQVTADTVTLVPHRAHYQPLAYNALHGGMLRLFDPMLPDTIAPPVWSALLCSLAQVCSVLKGEQTWFVEAHQFRIDTLHGIGRPTPEGAHRDGVDFVAILLVGREQVSGGESRIFEAQGRHGERFTLMEAGTLLLLDDHRVIHESTPIQPTAAGGHRDTLVLTFRSGGFLEPAKDDNVDRS